MCHDSVLREVILWFWMQFGILSNKSVLSEFQNLSCWINYCSCHIKLISECICTVPFCVRYYCGSPACFFILSLKCFTIINILCHIPYYKYGHELNSREMKLGWWNEIVCIIECLGTDGVCSVRIINKKVAKFSEKLDVV